MENRPSRSEPCSTTSDKRAYVKGIFSEIAGVYDLMNTIMSLGCDKRWRRRLIRKAAVGPGSVVLDLCCGTGEVAFEAAKAAGAGGIVFGLDFCPQMLERAKAKAAQNGFERRVAFIRGDALNLPFENGVFDSVTVAFGVRNYADISGGLLEIARVLRPGGRFACLDLSKPELPVFKQAYSLYFDGVVPMLGRLVHGKTGPYDYLPRSLKSFPVRGELCALIKSAGFDDVFFEDLMCGTVAIHTGVRM
jgi:demethylmenaquinone methyltransferase/2-methoxy-6-polyprenyl-1,4-benzoquinol methylase